MDLKELIDAKGYCEIPEGTTVIPEEAFIECRQLKSVTIPSSVTEIGARAFYGCKALDGVEMLSHEPKIGEDAFYGCAVSWVETPSSLGFICFD